MTDARIVAVEIVATFAVIFGFMTIAGHIIGHWVGDLETGYTWAAFLVTFVVLLVICLFIL